MLPFIYGCFLTIVNGLITAGTLETILIVAALYIIAAFINHEHMVKTFFYIILFYAALMSINMIIIIFAGTKIGADADYLIMTNSATKYALIVISKISLFVLCRIYIVFINRKVNISILETLIYILYPLISIMIICFIFNIILKYDIEGIYNNSSVFMMIMILTANIFIIGLYNVRLNSIKRENELEQKLMMRDFALKNLEVYRETLNIAKKIKHDIKNHIIIIKCYLQNKEYDKAIEYTDTVFKNIESIGTYITLENPIVTYLINSKLQLAGNNNIDINVTVENNIHSPNANEYDLCSIYGNILDNALENTAANGYINIDISEVNGYYVFSVKNSILTSVINNNPKLETAKNDKFNHGLGMDIVTSTVKKNNGMLDIYEDKSQFCVIVYLPY